ncbi:MAG: MFS transporter [Gammaproteobacteria bacterium]|nr:MFS transporter [Gammaproteobacteria bacterium]
MIKYLNGILYSALKKYIANYSGLPKACWQGVFFTLLESFAMGSCFFLSVYLVNMIHVPVTTAGIMISFYGVGTIAGGLISGKLCDRISSRIISLINLFLQVICFLLLANVHSIWFISIILLILGMAIFGFLTSNDIWALNQCKNRSDLCLKTINISRVALNLGLGLSGIMIGIIAEKTFLYIFYLSSFVISLMGIYLLLTTSDLTANTITQEKINYHLTSTKQMDKQILILILACLFFVGLIIAQLSTTYPLYIQLAFPEMGLKSASILFSLNTFLIVLFQAPLVNYIKKYNQLIIVGVGAFLMGFGMLILNFSFLFIISILSCVIWTIGEMLFMSMTRLICYEKGAVKKKGQSLGLYQMVYASSKIAGPVLGSFIYRYFGGSMVWYLSAVIGGACMISCYLFKRITSANFSSSIAS